MPLVNSSYLRHLIITLLGVFLFSCTALSQTFDINVDPTDDITITAQPGEWKEATNNPSAYGYNNQLKCKSMWGQYYVQIKAGGNLTSSGKPDIPFSKLKYMCTYVNFYDGSLGRSNEGAGTKYNYQSYADFSNSYANVYLAAVSESQETSDEVQPQFKYAVIVPDDQPPGVYDGMIYYKILDVLGGSSKEKSVNVRVTVTNLFQLSIDRGTVDFETLLPGQEKENVPAEGVIVTAKTNMGNPWHLKISDSSPLTSGPNMIPNSNFYWYGWTDGTGRWYGTGEDNLSPVPQLVYSSGAGESNNLPDGTFNHLKFRLKVPQKQRPGKYISTIKLTLTE